MALDSSQVMTFLSDRLGVDTTGLNNQSPLFSSSVVDSFSLVEMITFIETAAGIRIDAWDVTLDNFDSVDRILAFAASKE